MEKIILEKDQVVTANEIYKVAVGGEYEAHELVPVYHIDNPSLAIAALQAFYIANGFNLGEE